MNLARALNEVLVSLEVGSGIAVISHDTVATWDAGVLDAFVASGLLKKAATAQSIECHGCEERCFMDVVVQPEKSTPARAFVVCDVPGKQEIMGRVPIAPERLRQWQCTSMLLARFLCEQLGIDGTPETPRDSQRIRLGMLKGAKGRRWVSLVQRPLALEVNRQQVPIAEVLFVEGNKITLDWPRIRHALSSDAKTAGKHYAPNTDRRKARKEDTQAMYQDWQDAYAELAEKHPGMGKKWYSIRIARLPVAHGRDAETIRKRLN